MRRYLLLALLPLLATVSQAEVDSAHQVAPVLRKHCADCHMGMAKKGGFSMNTRESVLARSEDGAMVGGKFGGQHPDGCAAFQRQEGTDSPQG